MGRILGSLFYLVVTEKIALVCVVPWNKHRESDSRRIRDLTDSGSCNKLFFRSQSMPSRYPISIQGPLKDIEGVTGGVGIQM
ncbi:hypothetical protein EV421DRAFT_1822082 [Armillaria borealis]|uniref:Secreted protein n=1 Tax=Armillaria borealis TaxID=47425 RepID=A0AA39MLP2_9AGAR|nr:hypothetical protein EV421DRAFT_1822082 [Armillaria borealis]